MPWMGCGTLLAIGQHRRRSGLYGDELRGGPGFFNASGNTGDGAPGPHSSNEDICLAIGVAPHFLSGCGGVDGWVRQALELLWY